MWPRVTGQPNAAGESTYELDTQARPPIIHRPQEENKKDVLVEVSLLRLSKVDSHEEEHNICLWFPDNDTAVRQVSSLLEQLKKYR